MRKLTQEVRELTQEDTDLGTLIDIDEFLGKVIEGEIDDSDGYGFFVIDDEVETKELAPSSIITMYIPEDITSILWFNS